ncbi:transmembrane protein 164-like [Physella acuta]|uniref:transmembrane protein 164-like n=1 Tax=Physella acuta TaxID=109671 RepID=UPI0027DDBA34|nr:transmembrane protein 164-like [Physella acuta]XP_059163056.1 transmembrane protein 164-like [Physella acuta]
MAHSDHQKNDGWFDWAYKGVDPSFPGNGGLECRDFLSISQRCWESVGASIVAVLALLYAYPRLRLPRPCPCGYRKNSEPLGKRLLLLLMCLTFGIELGFKLATRQMIWIGNPCHLATMIQIFILAAPPSRIVTAAFRLHMHMLTGAPIAILFPVINTRLLPFETVVYFIQHFLMLIIPFYLLRHGDPFIPERLTDFTWSMVAFGFLFIYHFLPLQLLAYVSQVNLNNMLCPAVSDPFHGKFYRIFAICHQFLLIPTLGKLFVVLARAFNILPSDNPPDDTGICEAFCCTSGCSCYTSRCSCYSNYCCSSNVSTEETNLDTGDSTEDSGFAGTHSTARRRSGARVSTCSFPRKNSYSCKCSGSFPRKNSYSCKCSGSCCPGYDDDCRLYNYSSNSQCEDSPGSVMHIVNGKIVDEPPRKEPSRKDSTRKDPSRKDSSSTRKRAVEKESADNTEPQKLSLSSDR